MNAILRALLAGSVGAITTNLAHEIVRRCVPAAPRVDILGMQALAKVFVLADAEPPKGRDLYAKTLVGDVLSNTLYFSLCALGGSAAATAGTGLGVAAGVGAYAMPPHLGLDEKPTARTTNTKWLTVGLYTLGGFAAGSTYGALRARSSP